MKISKVKKQRQGLVTILNVVIIGGFMLGIMAIAYRASIRSLEGQKKVQLQLDYEAREQAFLRSIVTLAPKYAANTMINGSSTGTNADFDTMYAEAMTMAKVAQARTDADDAALGFAANTHRSGNTGDFSDPDNVGVSDIIGAAVAGGGGVGQGAIVTPSGVGLAVEAGYPGQRLYTRTGAIVNPATASTSAPLISSDISYTDGETAGDLRSYGLIPYPDIHFGYTSGDFIARQNWWKLYLHASSADRAATGVGSANLTDNEYILSIYEVPSQLAISSSAVSTNFGQIAGSAWDSSVTITGSVYAKSANVSGGSYDKIATTGSATVTGSTTVGAAGTTQISGTALSDRETYEATNNDAYYPISKASDYARSLFLPINPGLEFFDSLANPDTAQSGNNRLSRESWNHYTRGCHQCKMQLMVTGVVSAADQTPTDFTFSYDGGSFTVSDTPGAADYDWLQDGDADYELFPFRVTTEDGRPALNIELDLLVDWLVANENGAFNFGLNHSLLINTQWDTNGDFIQDGDIAKPSGTSAAGDLVVVLRGCDDLTDFGNGFSLVTNLRLYILEDLNQVAFSGTTYPPQSTFAPEIRIGDGAGTIDITGRVASLSHSTTGTNILDVKGSGQATATAARIKADLSAITSVDQLPPVNVMNWLVVIQKKL